MAVGDVPIRSAKVIQVIEIETKRGTGTPEDPVRPVLQYRTLDGDIIAEKDKYEMVDRKDMW